MDIRYIAGLFDGEGTLGVYANSGGGGTRRGVSLTNTYHPILITLQQRFGGGIYPQRAATLEHKATYQWDLQTKKGIEAFLRAVLPHLIIKRAQAQIMLAELTGSLDTTRAALNLKQQKRLRFQVAPGAF